MLLFAENVWIILTIFPSNTAIHYDEQIVFKAWNWFNESNNDLRYFPAQCEVKATAWIALDRRNVHAKSTARWQILLPLWPVFSSSNCDGCCVWRSRSVIIQFTTRCTAGNYPSVWRINELNAASFLLNQKICFKSVSSAALRLLFCFQWCNEDVKLSLTPSFS